MANAILAIVIWRKNFDDAEKAARAIILRSVADELRFSWLEGLRGCLRHRITGITGNHDGAGDGRSALRSPNCS
ncbi:hypothetical protein KCP75_20835 [Salmonella enterica subsp. enterica]|nr:hypothetical protein KCP75_20835 [Salmonella enterica subsp. enterica]